MKQNPTAGVHTFCDRQKPLPDGAAQYYVAGKAALSILKLLWLGLVGPSAVDCACGVHLLQRRLV